MILEIIMTICGIIATILAIAGFIHGMTIFGWIMVIIAVICFSIALKIDLSDAIFFIDFGD